MATTIFFNSFFPSCVLEFFIRWVFLLLSGHFRRHHEPIALQECTIQSLLLYCGTLRIIVSLLLIVFVLRTFVMSRLVERGKGLS